MKVALELDLSHAELTQLARIAGKSFLSSDDIERELRATIARELRPGVDVGYLYRVTYYREDEHEPHGFKLYTHTFMGQKWPHVPGRARLFWDGKSIRTTPGAFTVDAQRGFVDDVRPIKARGEKTSARAS